METLKAVMETLKITICISATGKDNMVTGIAAMVMSKTLTILGMATMAISQTITILGKATTSGMQSIPTIHGLPRLKQA